MVSAKLLQTELIYEYEKPVILICVKMTGFFWLIALPLVKDL